MQAMLSKEIPFPQSTNWVSLHLQEKNKYLVPVRDSVRSMVAWGWALEQDQARLTANRESMKRRMSKDVVRHTLVVEEGYCYTCSY